MIHRIKSLKRQWEGHIAQIEDNRWTKRILKWRLYKHTDEKAIKKIGRRYQSIHKMTKEACMKIVSV